MKKGKKQLLSVLLCAMVLVAGVVGFGATKAEARGKIYYGNGYIALYDNDTVSIAKDKSIYVCSGGTTFTVKIPYGSTGTAYMGKTGDIKKVEYKGTSGTNGRNPAYALYKITVKAYKKGTVTLKTKSSKKTYKLSVCSTGADW